MPHNPTNSCGQQNQSIGSSVQSACVNGGSSFACFDLSPWAVSTNLAYGYAAHNGVTCGQCYELDFTGQSNNPTNDPGSESLCGKTMIVQVVNTGGIANNQFDLMVPGGGEGANTGTCETQWGLPKGSPLIGAQNGGVLLNCQQQNSNYQQQLSCTTQACAALFTSSSESTLLAGCNWIASWLGGAANPRMQFKQVACPSAITQKSGLTDPG